MSASLRGKTIAFSGSFASLSGKREAVARAQAMGATVSDTVSKKIDVLVTGDSNPKGGMKEAVAKYHGTKIVPASTFLKFIQGGGASRMQKAALLSRPVTLGRARAAPVAARQLKAATKPAAITAQEEEEEEADFGPMPWEKGFMDAKTKKAFQLQKARALKARLLAKKQAAWAKKKAGWADHKAVLAAQKEAIMEAAAATAAAAAAAAPALQAPAAPATDEVKAAEAPTATVATDATSSSMTFSPSKGLTITFNGDFTDFKRAAEQVLTSQGAAAPAAVPTAAVPTAAVPTAAVPTAAVPVPVTEVAAPVAAAEVAKPTAAPKASGRTRTVVPSKQAKVVAASNDGDVSLRHKVVSFTGTFFQAKRVGLQALAQKAGAFVSTGVGQDIDVLVVGADAAHKKKLARQLGIPTLSEKEFIASCQH